MSTNLEWQHEDVFGKSFALYNKEQLIEFIEPLKVRFERNNLDVTKIFKGKRCLDAGCGNGRGSLLMLASGAEFVDCLDISQTNIASTEQNLTSFGYSNFATHVSSIEALPFYDQSYDFVWCNGVIMHAKEPDVCLTELHRVLKIGGNSWLYVYGAGGVYWWMMRRFREILSNIAPSVVMAYLQLTRYPVRYVAEYMDDWKVPYLRTYTAQDFGSRLKDLGFSGSDPLPYGVDYDTSQRRTLYPADVCWLGDGDLRYFLTREAASPSNKLKLSSSEYGSVSSYSTEIIQCFQEKFNELASIVADKPYLAMAACSFIQRELRDIMTNTDKFNIDAVRSAVNKAVDLAKLSSN